MTVAFVRSGGVQGTSFSFDIGPPGNNRHIIVFAYDESTGPLELTDVTVDGKSSALVDAQEVTEAGPTERIELWHINDTALGGSSGSVTVAIVGGDVNWAIHVMLFTGLSQGVPLVFKSNATTVNQTSLTVSDIDTNDGGLVVIGHIEGLGGLTFSSVTPPLVTRQDGPDPPSASAYTASGVEQVGQSAKSYTVTWTANFSRAVSIAASWDKAPGIAVGGFGAVGGGQIL